MPETDPLPPARLDELLRLCDAATPGPWEWETESDGDTFLAASNQRKAYLKWFADNWTPGCGLECPHESGIVVMGDGCAGATCNDVIVGPQDAAFIAACDPATVRALVAACRERDSWKTKYESVHWFAQQLSADADRLRAALAEAERKAFDKACNLIPNVPIPYKGDEYHEGALSHARRILAAIRAAGPTTNAGGHRAR